MMRRLVMLLAALAAPALAQPKVLRVVPHADLRTLDPMAVSVVITRIHGLMIYESLFAWDSRLQPHPQMVEAYSQSEDGLLWRFTLRPSLRFHDGQPVTTTDVVASLKRWMARDVVGSKLAAYIVSIDAEDARTLVIKLSRPAPFILFALGSAVGQIPVIMRAADAATDPGKPVTTTVGSGPFRFNRDEWLSGQRVVYDRNTDYVPRSEPADGLAGGRVVKVDRVEWRIIPDASTVAAALQSGEIDIWEQAAADLIPVLQRNRDIVVDRLSSLQNQGMLRPNALFPPFNDPRARRALAHLVDQRDTLAAGFGDEQWWRTCGSFFVCGSPYGSEEGSDAFGRVDIDRAKRLLAEAGYKGEKIVLITTSEIAWIGRMAEVVAANMRAAGMNVDLQYNDWGTMITRQPRKDPPDQGGWNVFVTGASGATMMHPLTNIGTNMTCAGTQFAGWPCDEEAEKLRQAFIDAPEAERSAALEALHRRLMEMQPYTLLGQWDPPYARRTAVTGVLPSPVIVYWNIDKP